MKQVTVKGRTIHIKTPEDHVQDLITGKYILRCLLYAPSGYGKSSMAATFPGSLGVIDSDSGSLVYRGAATKIVSIPEDSVLIDKGVKPEAWDVMKDTLEYFSKDPEVDTIIFDSFTTIADACIKHVMSLANRQGQAPSFVEWSRQMDLLRDIMFKAFSSKKNVISIFHEDVEKDDLTGKTWFRPLITGKLAAKVPGYYDEVYHLEMGKKDNKPQYLVRTKASQLYVAKSRLDSVVPGGVPEILPDSRTAFHDIMKKVYEAVGKGK